MKITVIGTGYVGLVTGACLADLGNNVLCFDLDSSKIDLLKKGVIPIYEPGLQDLVRDNASAGRLRFTTDPQAATQHGTLQFIAVGTPPGENGSADLQHVLGAAKNIAAHMNGYRLIINKSTVPVGTADFVRGVVSRELNLRNVSYDFAVVSNPEFLKEGAAIHDFMRPDRIVIGADDENSVKIMRQLYAPFERNRATNLW